MNMTIIVRISEDQYYDKVTGEHWAILDFHKPTRLPALQAAAESSLGNLVYNAFRQYEQQTESAQALRESAQAELRLAKKARAIVNNLRHICRPATPTIHATLAEPR